ncbi:50S ribosomal protein L6 [Blattabacterium sp. (Blattella germanica) str. Bge]|uniref:50S ribosomal protein L6 n=1 Tax=Blattabacterium sp. (Blattella germanica) TaxID=624186 RepID=UPI0001BB6147|nr:50S ribosomal protein L6 [Blattabacterium sp. (Blattella germanica)]ACY40273.1 50S ribosomal protein L6 [Blattabacterium sp. (Blattella germanica) str. Bge]
MSRIGKKPIPIPENVNIKIFDNKILVKGNLGSLSQEISKKLEFSLKKDLLIITRIQEDKESKSLHGLYRVLINNMIIGVTKGFIKELELVGIGYRASYKENILELNLGFSHNIMMQIPEEIYVEIKSEKSKNPILVLKSYDKQLLGIVSAKIRSFRIPDPYKGKGIRYLGEEIRKKAGKSA